MACGTELAIDRTGGRVSHRLAWRMALSVRSVLRSALWLGYRPMLG